ncbi:MAG: [LysW]-aminoadipate/[LysW]-glutamate kinase [Crenarchaeota archaeon]|nr:[LysW]-aminoadipate/[LysW]-glutamate kinase [Thermoproteota archaeon]MDW8033613.1 [LysW]-aminoadipate/[LysW]-glutamate kinase [Nitrososphaerota archaeon]
MIVVKVGGALLRDETLDSIVSDIAEYSKKEKVVFVHGGGADVTETCKKMGIEPRFVVSASGMRSRVTDWETMQVYLMTMGRINKMVVSKFLGKGVNAIGLTGIDGALASATRKEKILVKRDDGRRVLIDGGYTGKIEKINVELLKLLLDNSILPVLAPIAIGKSFEPLNVDSDAFAAKVASALGSKLLYLTNVEGLLVEGKLVESLTMADASVLLPSIGHGMMRKVQSSVEALQEGAVSVRISSGLVNKPVSSALEKGLGTLIVK